MSGWIIGLDKHLEVFPVGVGENFQRCVAKCILEVIGPEAKEACWSYYLYGGMEAGFEGRIHEMQFLCQQHIKEVHISSLNELRSSMRRNPQDSS